MSANLFDYVHKKLHDSSFILVFFAATLVLFGISVNYFLEDTESSRKGIELLERAFGVKPVNHWFTYWSMSLTPQIVQIVFTYLFLLDIRKYWWAAIIVAVFFSLDVVSDVQDRSNGTLFPNAQAVNLDVTVFVATILSVGLFTVGSELFLSVSAGLLIALFPSALLQFAKLYKGLRKGMAEAREAMGGPQQRRPSHNPPPQRQPVRERDQMVLLHGDNRE